jgi:large-conductance mechanosensitive channel
MIKEFKDFLFRGSIVEPAAAFVMGLAFAAVLTDLIQFVAIGAAVFFFIVKPVQMMLARSRREPIDEGMPDEERRHQELLAALRGSN